MSSFRSWNTMYFSLLGSPYLFMLDGVFPSLVEGWSTSFFSIRFPSISWTSCSKDTGSLFHHGGKAREKIFLITATSRMEKVFDILHSPSLYRGELIGVTVMDDTDFTHSDCTGGAARIKWWTVTKEVVDEVFINLPSEDYNISDLVSEFEIWGSMYRLISMPLLRFLGQ